MNFKKNIFIAILVATFLYPPLILAETQKINLNAIQKSANDGSMNAQISLGYLYSHGEEVPQDYIKAAKWYQKTADQGDDNAQYNLATLYYRGLGVPKNLNVAKQWYKKAAIQGNSEAKNFLDGLQ